MHRIWCVIMDNIQRISLLMDFYGQLITEKQYSILDMHYNSDYSLGEIAEYLNISRQGVYDNIKRGKDLLEKFEDKLGLVKKYIEHKQMLGNIEKILNTFDLSEFTSTDKDKINYIKDGIKKLLDDL